MTPEAVRVLATVSEAFGLGLEFATWDLGADRFLREGVTITEQEFRALRDEHDAILLGALGDPRVPGNEHARDILLGLRFRLDLYVNFRPCVVLDPQGCPLKGEPPIDLAIFRENTEGAYAGIGGRLRSDTPGEIAVEQDVNTRMGVERILRAAFAWARRRGRCRVTMVDKANAMPAAGHLWRSTFEEVAQEYPEIDHDAVYVDAMAMDLVRRPERYDVLVTSNLFGDILSDLAAQLCGGLGLAPSANVHPGRHGLFEPVHGSGPDIAGRGMANPLAAIRCGALLADHLGYQEAAEAIEEAVARCLREGPRTPDLGGTATTEEVGEWVAEALPRREATSTTG